MLTRKCCNCGLITAYGRMIPYRDSCPTDRGNEVREGEEFWCVWCQEDENSCESEVQDNG